MNTAFTFKDTGVTVSIRKVSPLLLSEIQRKYPAPKPPKNRVEIDGKVTYEENYADPDYSAALQEHGVRVEFAMRKTLIRLGVFYELTAEDVKKVEEMRAFWREINGDDLPGSDLEVFISYVAIGSIEDLQDLTEAITRRSMPTEAAIEEAAAAFKSDLQE